MTKKLKPECPKHGDTIMEVIYNSPPPDGIPAAWSCTKCDYHEPYWKKQK